MSGAQIIALLVAISFFLVFLVECVKLAIKAFRWLGTGSSSAAVANTEPTAIPTTPAPIRAPARTGAIGRRLVAAAGLALVAVSMMEPRIAHSWPYTRSIVLSAIGILPLTLAVLLLVGRWDSVLSRLVIAAGLVASGLLLGVSDWDSGHIIRNVYCRSVAVLLLTVGVVTFCGMADRRFWAVWPHSQRETNSGSEEGG